MPEAKFRVEGYFFVIVFPSKPSSLPCGDQEEVHMYEKRQGAVCWNVPFAIKWCKKLSSASNAPVWERGRLHWAGGKALGPPSDTYPTQNLQQAVHLLRWQTLVLGEVAVWWSNTNARHLPRSSGILSMYSHSQLSFFNFSYREDVFLRTEITVAWIRRELLTALLFFLIAVILC